MCGVDWMITDSQWLKGPQFLLMNKDNWSVSPVILQGTMPDPDILPVNDALEGNSEVKRRMG